MQCPLLDPALPSDWTLANPQAWALGLDPWTGSHWHVGAARLPRGGAVGGRSLPGPPRLPGHSSGPADSAQGSCGQGALALAAGPATPAYCPG